MKSKAGEMSKLQDKAKKFNLIKLALKFKEQDILSIIVLSTS